MQPSSARTVRLFLIGVIVVSVFALGWWYVFLKRASSATASRDQARGFSSETPTGSPLGSTYQNIVSTVASVFTHTDGGSDTLPPQMRRVTQTPVAGFGWVATGNTNALWFVERGTGYVFSVDPTQNDTTRLTGTLRPKIYDASISSRGTIVERGITADGRVETFLGNVSSTTEPAADGTASTIRRLDGRMLEPGIDAVSFSPDGARLAYAVTSATGTVFRTVNGSTTPETIYISGVGGWAMAWPGDIVLTQRAASGVVGMAFTLSRGALVPLTSAPGLTIAIASSSALLYGNASHTTLGLVMRPVGGAELQLPIRTTADKCAWAGARAFCAVAGVVETDFLDHWYRGETHTDDTWVIVDSRDGIVTTFPTEHPEPLDVVRPVVDHTGSYLAFQNARDGSLWIMRLTDAKKNHE